jgi:hypothetical protein
MLIDVCDLCLFAAGNDPIAVQLKNTLCSCKTHQQEKDAVSMPMQCMQQRILRYHAQAR